VEETEAPRWLTSDLQSARLQALVPHTRVVRSASPTARVSKSIFLGHRDTPSVWHVSYTIRDQSTQREMETVLLIEDEAAIADTVVYALETEGFRVEWLRLGSDGVERLERGDVGLVVLDIGLPDGSGFEFCKIMRRFSNAPILFLTARDAEVDRVVGLEIGADDYVTKPFSPRELAARVKAILRRTRGDAPEVARDGFELDAGRALIRYCGQVLQLTHYEYLILKTLLHRPGQVYTRRQIMQQVWENPLDSDDRSVDTHIKGIRGKLRRIAPEREPLKTHRGIGYSLDCPVREL